MKVLVAADISRVRISCGWDGRERVSRWPFFDLGRSPYHRAWQVFWIKGYARFDVVYPPEDGG